jgi:hypothetical protein
MKKMLARANLSLFSIRIVYTSIMCLFFLYLQPDKNII